MTSSTSTCVSIVIIINNNASWGAAERTMVRPSTSSRPPSEEDEESTDRESLEKAPLAAAPRDGISHSHLKKRQPVYYISLALAPTIFGNNLLRFKCFLYGPPLIYLSLVAHQPNERRCKISHDRDGNHLSQIIIPPPSED